MTAVQRNPVSEEDYRGAKDFCAYLRQLPVDAQKTFVDMVRGAALLASNQPQAALENLEQREG